MRAVRTGAHDEIKSRVVSSWVALRSILLEVRACLQPPRLAPCWVDQPLPLLRRVCKLSDILCRPTRRLMRLKRAFHHRRVVGIWVPVEVELVCEPPRVQLLPCLQSRRRHAQYINGTKKLVGTLAGAHAGGILCRTTSVEHRCVCDETQSSIARK